ncbi:bifunctional RNase H/acid phosphatase [Streptomyces avicenniae]|uniref:bifunctional RNase H/acid phosphatase n=1 Tax=Streptomyces avicenniae TaxID=500153 RepID=UPI00069AFCAC|nr:bifunctional RNase H/acid phosphatase [Streptomyces avicenniae]
MSGAAPGGRRLVVEADGGSRGNPGPAGYGALVLDAVTGEVLAETAAYLGTCTNNVAEYRGLIAGLRAAHALAPDAAVRVRMDSKLVVEQMSGRWKIKHPDMRPLAMEAREIFPAGAVTYEWMPRARNKHADRLANEAMDAGARGEAWRPAEPPAARTPELADPEPLPETPAVGWGGGDGPATTFLLLRHGETALTPQKRFSGSGGTDPELSATGLAQAAAAAEAVAAAGGVAGIVSSPLTRCRQTAEAVAVRLGQEIRIDEGLRETDFGAWEGLTFAEAGERYPDDLKAWLATPGGDTGPTGGETFTSVARRAAVARDKTIARHAGRTVLVVSHVTPIKSLLCMALGAPPSAMFRLELSAAGLSEIAYWPDGGTSVRRVNDTAHLRG